jgi:hypothetical protein
VKGVEHREIAFTGHAKDVLDAVHDQLVDQDFGGTAHVIGNGHFNIHPGMTREIALPRTY